MNRLKTFFLRAASFKQFTKEWNKVKLLLNSKKSPSQRECCRLRKILSLLESGNSDLEGSLYFEFCITEKVFSALALGVHSRNSALSREILTFFGELMRTVKCQDFFMQMEFHTSVKAVLLTVYKGLQGNSAHLEEARETAELIRNIIIRARESPFLFDAFSNESAFLPVCTLNRLIELPDSKTTAMDCFVRLVQINHPVVMDSVLRVLTDLVIDKLCSLYTDQEDTNELLEWVRFLDELCKCTTWKQLKEQLLALFFSEFLVNKVTHDMQSTSRTVKSNVCYYLSEIIKVVSLSLIHI